MRNSYRYLRVYSSSASVCVCAWTVGCCEMRIRSKRGNLKICSTTDAQHCILIARKSSDLHSPASTFFFFFSSSFHFIHAWRIDRRKVWQYFLISSSPRKKRGRSFSWLFFFSSLSMRVACCCRSTSEHIAIEEIKFFVWALLVIANPLNNFITPIKLEKMIYMFNACRMRNELEKKQ